MKYTRICRYARMAYMCAYRRFFAIGCFSFFTKNILKRRIMSEKILFRYFLRLKTEGFLKALLWGLAIGFGALAVFGMLHWFLGWKIAWVGILIWAALTVGATYAFYRWKYKPTTRYIARRVDDLGLHERILTMTELEGDESYIAKRQREDALASLASIREELLTIGVSVPAVVTASVAMALGVVGFLFASGVFKSYADINPVIPTTYEITYGVKSGEGSIVGVLTQSVESGEMTQGVVAVPESGWRFLRWDDQGELPYRTDKAYASTTYLAVFIEVNVEGVKEMPDDAPQDAPGEKQNQSSQQKPSEDPTQEEDQDDHEAQDKYEVTNQIIDGETYYGSVYDECYKDALEKLADEKYNDDQKELTGGYFENIEKGNVDDDEGDETEDNENN